MQPKLSWDPANCYNMMRFTPLMDSKLDIFAMEWKSKTLCRLFFNGDVTHRVYRKKFHDNHRNIFKTICSMERRLDNTLFRALLAPSIYAATKMVSSGGVYINGRPAKQPSYELQDGDFVQLSPGALMEAREASKDPFMRFWSYLPPYLQVNYNTASLVFLRGPEMKDIPHPFTRQMLGFFGGFYRIR